MFAPRGIGLTNRAPDAHVDAMRFIEHDFFADAQPATREYGLGGETSVTTRKKRSPAREPHAMRSRQMKCVESDLQE
jgi:hypothetical protein